MQDTYKALTPWLKSTEEYNEKKKSSTSEYFECSYDNDVNITRKIYLCT